MIEEKFLINIILCLLKWNFSYQMLLRDNLYSIRENDVFGLQFVYDNINRSLRVHVGHGY